MDIRIEKRERGKKGAKSKSTLSDKMERNLCDCEATKHPLVNNCISCGRIICLSEGPGPCFFCGNFVSYHDDPEYQLLRNVTELSLETDGEKSKSAYSADTLKLRDKLLEFDKDCASRTTVIDDECDYYQANNTWLTEKQREQWKHLESNIQEQKHKSRLSKSFSVDFTGRVVDEEEDPLALLKQMNSIQNNRLQDYSTINCYGYQSESFKGPIYIGANILPSNTPKKYCDDVRYNNRIQDKGFLEISDQGVCLSVHQPYASLLVRGIKKTEGRTWYSSHRGRLWIASAAKEPTQEEIKAMETFYSIEGSENVGMFPKSYPTGCLIGCVTVTDVLSQEEFDKLNPDNKVDSPYIFICEDNFELPMKYPIQGKHKIYKLDPVIHRTALNCLEKTCMKLAKNSR